MTRTQFDALFSESYAYLIGHANRRLNRDDGPDLVHQVYCQIVTSESFRDQRRGVKDGTRWLLCRLALQVKAQKRTRWRRREDPLANDDVEDDY